MDPRRREANPYGVITARGPVSRNRVLNALSIFVPMTGAFAALALVPALPPTTTALWVFLGFFVAETLGLGLGLHRYFTHRAFRIGPAGRLALGILGSWAMQGPIARWVADHRRHHRFTDAPGDPHSPHWIDGRPARSPLAGLWHAHFAWMLTGVVSDEGIYAADVRRDPIARWCSDHYALLCASSLLAPALVGGILGGAPEAALGVLWAGCLRVALLQQLTWSVNSLGHRFGTKVPGSRNEARDNLALALLLFGEGLHSYHHRHPGTALNRPRAIDLNGQILRGLERLGVVWGLRRYD